MKKLLAIIVLGLLLVSCVAHDMERFKNQNINYKTGDVRVNVVEGDKNSVYVGLWVAESDYKIDEKVLKKLHDRTKLGLRWEGPYPIERVHVNGNVTVALKPGVLKIF